MSDEKTQGPGNPPPMSPDVAQAWKRILLRALAVSPEDMEPIFAAAIAGVRPDAAALGRVVPYVRRFFDAATRDGFGHALGLTWAQSDTVVQRLREDLSEDDARAWARQLTGHLNGEDPKQVIVDLAIEAIDAGRPLPPRIAPAVSAMLRGRWEAPARRGPDPYAHDTRDFLVTMCVHALCWFGFTKTRNSASEHPSACSIVADIAGLSEAAVVKIATKKWSAARASLLDK